MPAGYSFERTASTLECDCCASTCRQDFQDLQRLQCHVQVPLEASTFLRRQMITHDQSRFAAAASVFCCALLGSCFAANFASADGPSDNNPVTVRRIPKLGITIPPQREAALREKLSTLQQQLAELSTESSEVTRWLPDVMIFERAVRSALDYQEFFAEEELDRADRLLDEGLAHRPVACRQGSIVADNTKIDRIGLHQSH